MNFAAVRNLNRIGVRNLRFFHKSIYRATEAPKDPCGCEAKPPDPPCPPKAPEPPPPPKVCSPPQPPPCPSMPQCPPTLCPPFLDPGNPCNYTPPPCPDPDYFDLRRLKANQCKFQADDGVPIFIKRGTSDVIFYQVTLVLIVLSLVYFFYVSFKPLFPKRSD